MTQPPERQYANTRWIALLRGINLGNHNKIPMAELRELCTEIGWAQARTYIQSGNIVFTAPGPGEALENRLTEAIAEHFGHDVPTIVRAAEDWPVYIQSNPFPGASEREPNRVMLALARQAPAAGAAENLQQRATASERVVQSADALWIHFAGGSGRSKLTPALLNRLAGSPVTTRNWRTVVKLGDMLEM